MTKYTVTDVTQHDSYQVLSLEPQSEDEHLSFWPGQYAAFSFRNGTKVSPMRSFSIVSSPHDSQLQFAMRPQGRFTRKVATLRPGDSVQVRGPFGNFVLDPSDKSIIMLAAGIGITPYISMLRYMSETSDKRPVTLLYAARDSANIPFEAELRQLQSQNPQLRVIFVVKQGTNDPARNIYVGRIDESLMQRVTAQRWQPFSYFICGPASFLESLQSILRRNDVVEDRIITESFTQSSSFNWRLNKLSIPTLTYALTGILLLFGIGSVMALDLLRVLPKAKAASLPAATTSSSTTTSTASDQSTSNSTAASTSPSSSTTTQTAPTTTNYSQMYQAPVSSVS